MHQDSGRRTRSHAAGRALFLCELHPPADHFGGILRMMQGPVGSPPLVASGESLSHAADHHASRSPRWQHVIDHEGDVRVVLRVAEFPGPGEVPATDVDHVQPRIVAPAEGNDVGASRLRRWLQDQAELALGQVSQLGIQRTRSFRTHPPAVIVKGQWARRYTRRLERTECRDYGGNARFCHI